MTLELLYDYANTQNIHVYDIPTETILSLSLPSNDICINRVKMASAADEKVCLAHELGHCITGSFYNQYSQCDIRERHECRANKWAFHKLLPYEQLMCAVKEDYTEVWQIAELFSLPDEFTAKAIAYYKGQYECV